MCRAMSCATSRAFAIVAIDTAELDQDADGAALVLHVLVRVEQPVGSLEPVRRGRAGCSRRAFRPCPSPLRRRSNRRRAGSRRRRRPCRRRDASSSDNAFLKGSPLATKSVSQFSSTSVPTLPSTRTSTAPWSAARPSRLAAPARPFSRSQSFAASMSPSFSCSAFLQSIIPAPVILRSAATSFAVISAIVVRFFRHSAGVSEAVAAAGSAAGSVTFGVGSAVSAAPAAAAPFSAGGASAAGGGGGGACSRALRSRAAWSQPPPWPRPGAAGTPPPPRACAAASPVRSAHSTRRRQRVPGRALRRDAMCLPSMTASAITRHMSCAERIASSLPGIT